MALAPGFSSYQWVSTNGGVIGAGRLQTPTGQEADGSFAQTPTFTVAAGDTLNFYFNYITTDGHEFTEYAWAGCFSGAGAGTFESTCSRRAPRRRATPCPVSVCPDSGPA